MQTKLLFSMMRLYRSLDMLLLYSLCNRKKINFNGQRKWKSISNLSNQYFQAVQCEYTPNSAYQTSDTVSSPFRHTAVFLPTMYVSQCKRVLSNEFNVNEQSTSIVSSFIISHSPHTLSKNTTNRKILSSIKSTHFNSGSFRLAK